MYTVDKNIIKSILRKKFNSFVGTSCETIESLFKEDLNNSLKEKLIKQSIKKYAYNTMRDIEDQISTFSEGVNINVQFNKPISE